MDIWAIIPLITCLIYVTLLVLSLSSVKTRVNRIFAYYVGVAATWSFTSFMLHLNAFPQQALLWNELLVVALIWTLIAYYHFVRAYADKPAGALVYLGYALVAILAVLSLSGYIVQYSYVTDGVLYHSLGNSIYVIGVLSLTFIGAVIVRLVRKYRVSIDLVERNRIMYLVAGWIILVLLTYTNLIPAVAGLPLDHIGSLINALIISYAISRFHLIDIRFATRRGLAYLLLISCLSGAYIGSVLLGQKFFPTLPIYSIVLIAIILVFLLVVLARPLRLLVEKGVDRVFYRGTYEHRKRLLSFGERMGNVINLSELAEEMLPAIGKALRIKEVKLFFENTDSGDFVTQFSYPVAKQEASSDVSLTLDNPIVTWLEREAGPLDLSQLGNIPQLKGLWQAEKEKLRDSGFEFLCSIKSRGELVGILALGRKEAGAFYTHEDIIMVRNVANQAGAIIENAKLYSQAVAWANTDGLTGLYNHRFFHERLEQEIGRSSRFASIFSLVMLDIDLFKAYNDIYGHLAGDEVIRRVAKGILASIRTIDMAFRYGGEEFAVILPETRLDDAYRVAERIRKTIESGSSTKEMPITASLGVASWPLDGMMKEEVVARADKALYRAKQMGRNQVCLSSDLSGAESQGKQERLQDSGRSLSIIYALAATVDAKDSYTYGHSRKVSDHAATLAEALDLPQERVDMVRAAGMLHDIGKIGIPDHILKKGGPLTEEEWEPIRAHPQLGVDIIRHVSDFRDCLPVILHHHERYDGKGYPAGLKGENIPLEARILAIADAYDAMTSLRAYREQLTPEQAIAELKRCAGTQFDPKLVESFCRIIESLAEVAQID